MAKEKAEKERQERAKREEEERIAHKKVNIYFVLFIKLITSAGSGAKVYSTCKWECHCSTPLGELKTLGLQGLSAPTYLQAVLCVLGIGSSTPGL